MTITISGSAPSAAQILDFITAFQIPNVSSDLVAPNGSNLVGFLQSGTGAVGRTVKTKLSESVSAKDFGAVGDGITDDTVAIQDAVNSLSNTGGGVVDIGNYKVRILSNLVIHAGCTLTGRWINPEQVGPANAPEYGQYAGIRLASTATIILGKGATICNLIIIRDGMTFPAGGESLYAGTAITSASSSGKLENLLVLGFNKLFLATGQRYVCNRVFGDNRNGIDISGSPDVNYISKCHMWPFAENTGIYPSDAVNRSGVAFYLHDVVDWAKVTDCFSYAYFRGFQVSNANSCNFVSCSADHNHPRTQAGAIGFLINGTSNDTKIVIGQSAAQACGVYIDTVIGMHTEVVAHTAWATSDHSILVNSGDASIIGGSLRDTPNGVTVNNSSSKVLIDNVRFNSISNLPINVIVDSSNVLIGKNDYGNFAGISPINSLLQNPTLASASVLTLLPSHEVVAITGGIGIDTLQGGYAGRRVVFIFTQAINILHNTSPNGMKLNNNINFAAQVGSTLSLISDGSRWYETGRVA